MTEQKLFMIEATNRCKVCESPFVADLVAEVRRLQAERDAYKKAKAENDDRFMGERDAALAERSEWEEKWAAANASYSDTLIEAKNRAQMERDASGAHLRETILELRTANDYANSQSRAAGILAAKVEELANALQTALAERDRAERNEREYRAACEMSIGALRDSRERWEQRTVLAEAERDAARAASQNAHECLFETEQSLSEARRVLRAQDECMVCKAELFRDLTVPHCFDCVVEDEHAEEWDAICAAKAAVLAQDTDA